MKIVPTQAADGFARIIRDDHVNLHEVDAFSVLALIFGPGMRSLVWRYFEREPTVLERKYQRATTPAKNNAPANFMPLGTMFMAHPEHKRRPTVIQF